MGFRDYFQLALFLVILGVSAKPLGIYLEKVFDGSRTFLSPVMGRVESLFYRLTGLDPGREQHWSRYAIHLLAFSAASLAVSYAILRLQGVLPLNPAGKGLVRPDLAWNASVSFMTNTNWQSYGGETTMSYLSQMAALASQNFFSAAVGIAVAVALIRGISRRESETIGNFWADLIRCHLYVLLPLALVLAIFLMSQGVIQNFSAYREAITMEGNRQVIAQGPVASQVAIKVLGTNGGGFFRANSAHPYENPTPLSNFVEMLSVFLLPSGLVHLLGRKTGNSRHSWAVWTAMALLFVAGAVTSARFEYRGNPVFKKLGCSSAANMEGKEVRFGIFDSALFATITTDASCGAVNSMHDSFTPLGGLVLMVNMLLGGVIFGGVGAGLYGMLMYVILAVFIAGLMVGRTPEYLGKKIEALEVKYVTIALIVMALLILGFASWGVVAGPGLAARGNPGEHGFSEILYAYASGTTNNGSAFGGISADTPFWNLTLAFAMFLGRFFAMIPMLAVAGSLARKKIHPSGEGTFPVDGLLFVALLIAIVTLVGALTFFPALSLGPIAEHFDMVHGHFFK